MKYQVLENGKPCDCNHHKVDRSWNNSIFDSYEVAREYAWKWIAPYGGSYDGKEGIDIPVNTKVDYYGTGDCCIEIKEVK